MEPRSRLSPEVVRTVGADGWRALAMLDGLDAPFDAAGQPNICLPAGENLRFRVRALATSAHTEARTERVTTGGSHLLETY